MDETRAFRPSIDRWFIVFEDCGNNVWWHHWLRPGFKHCWAFGYDLGAKLWIRFEVIFDGCDIRTMTHAEVDEIVGECHERGWIILEVEVERVRRPKLRFLASCVSATAHLCNLPRGALTPYGLYQKLLAHGAKPAFVLPAE